MKIVPIKLMSHEVQTLSLFVLLSRETRQALIQAAIEDPAFSGPLLYAYRVVDVLLA